jgi:hypothetical protein
MKARYLFPLISGVGVLFSLYLINLGVFDVCDYGLIEGGCNPYLYIPAVFLFFAYPVFALSLIVFFANTKVQSLWQKFTLWFVGICGLITVFASEEGGGGWISGGSPTKATYGLLLSALYLISAVIFVAWKAWKLRKK